MQIKFVHDHKHVREFTKFFHMNLAVQMLAFANEYKFLYGRQVQLEKAMHINLYLSPLIIMMSNADYNLVMRSLFHNISYDDGCDQFLVHEFAS